MHPVLATLTQDSTRRALLRVSVWNGSAVILSNALSVGLYNIVELVARAHRFHYLDGHSPFNQSSIHCSSELQLSTLHSIEDLFTKRRTRAGSSPHVHGKRDRIMVRRCQVLDHLTFLRSIQLSGVTRSHIHDALEEAVPGSVMPSFKM
ncbi:hypothetical protein EVAR_3886_1 [Eumeta japonica]|uniref:Uncharacterized protein n=1 Tax=Eumeta variegata TaxID=151549 RepID=A0A4C1STY3_EUMVA|nr:hypothetical protein EVAR_3886_1 [Eumeta japonica]